MTFRIGVPLLVIFAMFSLDGVSAKSPKLKVKKGRSIQTIPLERYVEGVLMGEVPQSWPIEALKAQAVAVRSYAMFRKNNPRYKKYDLLATVHDQVFNSSRNVPEKYKEAVRATRGELLKNGSKVIPAYFHSCCGGMTEDSNAVWGGNLKSFGSVRDPHCTECPNYNWEVIVSKKELRHHLESILRPKGANLSKRFQLSIKDKQPSGRVKNLEVQDRGDNYILSPLQLRRSLGYSRLKSNWYSITEQGGELLFSGRGFGHGVGLCQWGAKGMADAGFGYREILNFYYKDVKIDGKGRQEVPPEIQIEADDIIEDLLKREEDVGAGLSRPNEGGN